MTLIVFAIMLFDRAVLNDPDTYWHLAAGEWMLAHGQVVRTDPFSFTHAGQPWIAHEWLSEILMASAYRLGGWSGVMLTCATSMGIALVLFTKRLGRWLSGLPLLASIIVGLSCAAPGFLDRPHVLVLPVLLLWTDSLLRAREVGAAPPLWLAALMTLWANLHGSFLLGFVVAAALGVEALLDPGADRRQIVRTWGLWGALAFAASLISPHGVDAYPYAVHVMSMKTLGAIGEWRSADFSSWSGLELALLTGLMVAVRRDLRLSLPRAGLLLLLLHMALQHYRHQFVLGFLAPMLLAQPIGLSMDALAPARPWRALALGLCALSAAVISSLFLLNPVSRSDSANTPATAFAHVPVGLRSQPVLNSHAFGGYLIFEGVRPFIDGRTDMYGDRLFQEHIAAMNNDLQVVDELVKRYQIRWTILSPEEPLVRGLDRDKRWRPLYRDRWAVVHERITP